METCPDLHNVPCIFIDLSYMDSPLTMYMYGLYMYMYFLPGIMYIHVLCSNFAPFEEVKVLVSNSADFFPKKCI